MLERIMVPTDGSPESEHAFPIAEQIAAAHGAELLFFQVVPYPVLLDNYSIVSADVYQQMLDATAEEAQANLSLLKAQYEDRGFRVTSMLFRGSPAPCLLDAEREHGVDLVVMATHGRTGLARFALGSVADRMVREGIRPVLIARNVGLEAHIRTALLMLDGSGVAEESVPMAEVLARRPVEKVKLFRVVADPADRSAAATYLEAVSARLRAGGLETEIVVDLGDPTFLVRRAAQGTDLVILATHGRGGVDRFRHGSVAERVVREAEKPVLLIRAGMSSPVSVHERAGAAVVAPVS